MPNAMMVCQVTLNSPMRKTKVDFDTVRKIGLALPEVEETMTAYKFVTSKGKRGASSRTLARTDKKSVRRR